MNEKEQLEALVSQHVSNYLAIASAHYQQRFLLDNLLFNLRGMAAGQFVVKQAKGRLVRSIRINSSLLAKYGEEFINEVVPHECAHLVVFEQYGKGIRKNNKRVRPHGPEWKRVMQLFGKEPKVRHDFLITTEEKSKYHYTCGCSGKIHELTKIRHNKVKNRGVKYQCKKCLDILLPNVIE